MAQVFPTPAALLGSEGTRLGPTDWLLIDQQRVDAFAMCTGDHQWIHVDVERARTGPFGGTIAHGFLTLSLVNLFLPQLLEVHGVASGLNVGADRLRFLAPVLVGRRIRAVGEILSAEAIKNAVQATIRVTIEIEAENGQPAQKPALVIDKIARFYPQAA